MVVYQFNSDTKRCEWVTLTTTGDLPTPRSGHAACAYRNFLFLFGGIDFSEEVAYNDLYLYNSGPLSFISLYLIDLICLDTRRWRYIGEKGETITGRNSHSLHLISISNRQYLILFGGASPENGPSSGTYYALLPDDLYLWGRFVVVADLIS